MYFFMLKNNALFYPLSFEGLVFWRNLINFFTSSGTAAVLQADKQGTKSSDSAQVLLGSFSSKNPLTSVGDLPE